jgi:hypothetical protein
LTITPGGSGESGQTQETKKVAAMHLKLLNQGNTFHVRMESLAQQAQAGGDDHRGNGWITV